MIFWCILAHPTQVPMNSSLSNTRACSRPAVLHDLRLHWTCTSWLLPDSATNLEIPLPRSLGMSVVKISSICRWARSKHTLAFLLFLYSSDSHKYPRGRWPGCTNKLTISGYLEWPPSAEHRPDILPCSQILEYITKDIALRGRCPYYIHYLLLGYFHNKLQLKMPSTNHTTLDLSQDWVPLFASNPGTKALPAFFWSNDEMSHFWKVV